MLVYLTSLHVSYVLTDPEPKDPYMMDGENVPTKAQVADYEKAVSQWNHNECNYRNYILNALDDSLYDIYSTFLTAREIWESLEKKYMTQVVGSKKFVVGKFLNFKMNDAKPVVKQVEELQIIFHEMELYLKHLTDDMSFEQLVLKIRVEEDNMTNEKADANSIEPNANMVGESSSKSKSNHKNKGKNGGGSGQKHSKDGKKDCTQQNKYNFKKVYHCWVCGKPGHKAKDCRHKKEYGCINSRVNSNQANYVESPKEFARVIESFLTINVNQWFMGNGTASKIEGKGKVILKLTFGKGLVLSNVLHVPNITKNLIYGPILSNKGFKLVFESNKFVITKGGMYVRKGYLDEGLFKLSVVTDDNVINYNNAGTSTPSVYMIDPSFLWHSRLGHKLVDLPSGHKPIGHKWIFKKKLRPGSTIGKYKARLAAKGYRQKEGQDFSNTYSPVTRITSIRTLIAIATIHKLIIHQMNMKTAFLNGELDEETYMQKPKGFVVKGQEHKDALVRVLQYPKHTTAHGLPYIKYPPVLEGFCDATWISNHNEGKSTSGYVFTLGGADVSWKSSKQIVNTRSNMEAEFVALDKAAKKIEWLKSFLEGIPLWPKPMIAVCIHCDSIVALTRAKNHIYNGKSRHIRRHHNTIKDLLRNGFISIDYELIL
ncbi:DNA polymerase zeta catalytic subunit-like protein [Tanacetum coccineum]